MRRIQSLAIIPRLRIVIVHDTHPFHRSRRGRDIFQADQMAAFQPLAVCRRRHSLCRRRRGIIPKYLLTNLQSPAEPAPIGWSKSNIIVLLGAGTEKIAESGGIEVGIYTLMGDWRNGRAPRFLETGRRAIQGHRQRRRSSAPWRGGADVYGAYLQQLGVDKSDLILEKRSQNTWENAQFTAPLITALFKQENAAPSSNILLVTSGFHMRRSLLYFNRFGIRAQAVRADYISTTAAWFPLAYNFLANDIASHEYVGMWRYRVYELMGWNGGRQTIKFEATGKNAGFGLPYWNRTSNLCLRRALLYPVELRAVGGKERGFYHSDRHAKNSRRLHSHITIRKFPHKTKGLEDKSSRP